VTIDKIGATYIKVQVTYTVEVDDDYRRAIRAYYGRSGLATRREVANWCRMFGETMDDELMRQEEEKRVEPSPWPPAGFH